MLRVTYSCNNLGGIEFADVLRSDPVFFQNLFELIFTLFEVGFPLSTHNIEIVFSHLNLVIFSCRKGCQIVPRLLALRTEVYVFFMVDGAFFSAGLVSASH